MTRRLAAGLALMLAASSVPTMHASAAVPGAAACPFFPTDNIWNTDISALSVNTYSAAWVNSMRGGSTTIHPDFGQSGDPALPYGFPYAIVDDTHPTTPVAFDYAAESDAGPYPFGAETPIEGGAGSGGDQHALMVNRSSCTLYELYGANFSRAGSTAGSGAIWNLNSDALRPDSWTSADAAGLPIFPGLLRYDEVQSGSINHAVRFTAVVTQTAHLWPARHDAGSTSSPSAPPMGARFRLRAGFDVSHYSAQAQTILRAFQHYGMILADNGSNWYVSGTADNAWPDSLIAELKTIPAGQFDAVDESALEVDANSAAARQPVTPPGVGGAILDGFGGLHQYGAVNLDLRGAPYWRGFDIARGVCLGDGGGYVLDGYGGVHAFGAAPAFNITSYWAGWDIARGIALRPGGGAYVLDAYGGIHPAGGAPPVNGSAYWPGWQIARGIAVRPSGGGYVLDGFGGLHPFGGAPAVSGSAYWGGWDIARALTLDRSGNGGWVLDGFGGVHPFGDAESAATTWYTPGQDLARSISVSRAGGGYVLDAWGGVHPFGGAPWVNAPALWPGWNIARSGDSS